MKEAVLVDIADVADRAHAAVRRSRLLGLLRIVEIFKRRGRLEPDLSWRAGGAWFHVFVENMELAEQPLADGPAMGEPFRAVAGGEAKAFGRAVIFVDDRSPPFDHVVLHHGGARRGGMDRDLERGDVVARAHLLRQLEHAREHRRYEL